MKKNRCRSSFKIPANQWTQFTRETATIFKKKKQKNIERRLIVLLQTAGIVSTSASVRIKTMILTTGNRISSDIRMTSISIGIRMQLHHSVDILTISSTATITTTPSSADTTTPSSPFFIYLLMSQQFLHQMMVGRPSISNRPEIVKRFF